jgi:hypothetical protein
VSLFRSEILYGSGDEEDAPQNAEEQQVECYHLELRAAGDDGWGACCSFRSLEEVDQFNREKAGRLPLLARDLVARQGDAL